MGLLRHARRVIPGFYLFVVLFLIYLPIFVVVAFSFNESSQNVFFTGFTLDWYKKLFGNRKILEALSNSLTISLWSCGLAAVIGTVGAVGLARSHFRTKGMLESVSSLPIMIPEIIIAMAFLTFFTLVGIPMGMMTLILSHTTFCIPYVLIIVRSRLVGLDKSYEEAARDLGASAARAFVTITVPLVMPAVASGVLLAFAMSLDDVIISMMVNGPETTTLPMYIYGQLRGSVKPDVNALCTIMLGATFLIVALSQLIKAKSARS